MALHDELLEQAAHLLERDFKQASRRRSISAAYYAVFHMLAEAATNRVAGHLPHPLQSQIRRAFGHSTMADVCRQFDEAKFPKSLDRLIVPPIEEELRTFARIFRRLREMRERADCDLSSDIDLLDAIDRHTNAVAALAEKRKISAAAR